ncbi:MAG: hypothetical protein ACRD2A_15720 [Vicinamibacterales bacterium]
MRTTLNDVGLTDFAGCNWLSGYSVWCHYSPPHHDEEIRTLMLSRGLSVVALADDTAVVFDSTFTSVCPTATPPLVVDAHLSRREF